NTPVTRPLAGPTQKRSAEAQAEPGPVPGGHVDVPADDSYARQLRRIQAHRAHDAGSRSEKDHCSSGRTLGARCDGFLKSLAGPGHARASPIDACGQAHEVSDAITPGPVVGLDDGDLLLQPWSGRESE